MRNLGKLALILLACSLVINGEVFSTVEKLEWQYTQLNIIRGNKGAKNMLEMEIFYDAFTIVDYALSALDKGRYTLSSPEGYYYNSSIGMSVFSDSYNGLAEASATYW